jgi:acyl-coenzyme A synthetase/AMP-(fatty) acid ligase
MKRLPHVTFTNLYGPTETTIASSYYTVQACPTDEKASIPIGRACEGEELLVLDEQKRTVPTGTVGDLYISGVGVGLGYWKDSEKTAAAFHRHPFREDNSERIYRTGDLAKIGEDGLVYFVGRADTQIKSRGYRIELGEIEAALSTLAWLRETAVVGVPTGGFEGTVIACAYVPHKGISITPSEIRAELKKALPSYMLPSLWKCFQKLPQNANGKVDRKALREVFGGEVVDHSGDPR